MCIKIYNEIQTMVFCEVECVYKTERLWRCLENQLSNQIPTQRAIYNIPEDTFGVHLDLSKYSDKTFVVYGVTESGYCEAMTSITMAFGTSMNDRQETLKISEEFKQRLLELAEEFDVEIVITKDQIFNLRPTQDQCSHYINLLGLESHISAAYLHLWSLVRLYDDNAMGTPSIFIESLEIDAPSLLPLAMGVELANIKNISSSYKTDVHIPSLIPPFENDEIVLFRPQIFFSGEIHSLVLAAKDVISRITKNSDNSFYYRRFSNISPPKLLFIRKYYQSELNRLMVKYQSFVRVTDTFVDFQSPCVALLESITKVFTVNVLHQIVEVQITLNEDLKLSNDFVKPLFTTGLNNKIVLASPLDNSNQWLIVGNHSEVSTEINSSSALLKRSKLLNYLETVVSALPPHAIVQLKSIFEIHVDYEDFIAGKKNGKVTRIMESIPCLIKLERLEEDSTLFLSLVANSLHDFSETFSMVINELPAEESFFIPEVYHRPVIGAGGSVIQSTMKKYNVFVRFSNSFFLPQNELCHVRYDNVIIRCPYKNVSSISSAKDELNQLARDYGRMQPRTLIKLSPGQYRHILSNTSRASQIIGNLEKKHNVYVMFPFVEPHDGYLLEIRGNDDSSFNSAKELISTSFGIETELHLNGEIELNDDFYNSLVVPFKYKMNIELHAKGNMLRMTHEGRSSFVDKALVVLSNWFKEKNLEIVSKEIVCDFIIHPEGTDNAEIKNTNPNFKKYPQQMYQNQITSLAQNPHGLPYVSPKTPPSAFYTSFLDNRHIMESEYTRYSPTKGPDGWH